MARFPARTSIGRRTRATKPAKSTRTQQVPRRKETSPWRKPPKAKSPTSGVNGTVYPDSKTVIFDAANATAGTMKRRGRKKAE